jgi:hypothetical protein
MCIFTTVYLLCEIYIVKRKISISDIIIRSIFTVIVSVVFEKYLDFSRYFPHIVEQHIKKPTGGIISYVCYSVIYGALIYGVGVGTFIIFVFKFIMMLPITFYDILFIYKLFLIGGFFVGNIGFIGTSINKLAKR